MLANNLSAVFLDQATLGDTSIDALKNLLPQLRCYPTTSSSEIYERVKNAEIIITNKVVFDAPLLQKLPKLKLLIVTATGTNNIDVAYAKQQNILVCNTPNYSTTSVAHMTLTYILMLMNHVMDYDRDVKKGEWTKSPIFTLTDYPIFDLSDKKLGIIGYGLIGQAVAHLAKAFGMQVLLTTLPHQVPRAGRLPFEDFLSQLDVLSIHCPLTPETKNLITTHELKLLPKSAVLINVARGGIVNEADLASALIAGDIAGAAVDVLSQEPPAADNPLLNLSGSNLIITPHIAWASEQSKTQLLSIVVKTIKNYLAGAPINKV